MNMKNNKKLFRVFIFASIILFFTASILAGCATMESGSIHRLKVRVRKLNKKTAELSQNQSYTDKKLSQMQLNTANNGVKLSSLNAKIRDIYGKYEVESHNIRLLQKRFREYRLIVNKELVKLLKLAKLKPVPPKKALKTRIRKAVVERESAMESEFKRDLSLFNKKKYGSAISDFRKFLNKYPQSKYAADALFYKAFANFDLKRYPVSILEFHKFSRLYPKNTNIPMSIYLQGVGFLNVSDPSDASILFRQVIAKYPETKAAALSKQELNKLSK